MVAPQHAGLSITRQCRLVSITRSSFYDGCFRNQVLVAAR